jgi:hypothetical protein
MSSARLGNALSGAVAATVVALGLSYVVTAGLMPSAQPGAGGAPVPKGTAPGLALTHAPELRARPALFRAAPVIAQPAPATAMAAEPAARPAATQATAEPSTSAPATTPAQSNSAAPAGSNPAAAPPAEPQPKAKPSLSARPAKPSRPDFDETAPGGFDSAG